MKFLAMLVLIFLGGAPFLTALAVGGGVVAAILLFLGVFVLLCLALG
jgi:hypothetical protein